MTGTILVGGEYSNDDLVSLIDTVQQISLAEDLTSVARSLLLYLLSEQVHGRDICPEPSELAEIFKASASSMYRAVKLLRERDEIDFRYLTGKRGPMTFQILMNDTTVGVGTHVVQDPPPPFVSENQPSISTSVMERTKRQKKKRTKASGAQKRKSQPALMPEQIQVVCASARNISLYLLFGKKVLVPQILNNPMSTREEQQKYLNDLNQLGVKPANTNWRVYGVPPEAKTLDTEHRPYFEKFTTPHPWAGWFWFWVSIRRYNYQMPITLPVHGFPYLFKLFRQMMDSMPPKNIYEYIVTATIHHAIIRYKLQGKYQTIGIGEALLTNQLARSVIQQIPRVGTEERNELLNLALQKFPYLIGNE